MRRRHPERRAETARSSLPPDGPGDPQALSGLLVDGLSTMGLALPEAVGERLLAFLDLLVKWNRAYNLTAVRKPEQMITRHLLDSLTVLPYLHGRRVLDVGTGAGLPGLPLAMARGEYEFVLLDSNRKKTRFVTQAVNELGLANVEVVSERVEDYRPAQPFDTVVSRAFSTVGEMLQGAGHLGSRAGNGANANTSTSIDESEAGGVFLAMKGVYPLAELEALPPGYQVEAVHALSVPGLEAERHLVVCRHAGAAGAM